MPPFISEEEMDKMSSGDESDDEPMSRVMLEDIHDVSKSHPSVNRREAHYKIRDHIKQSQEKWEKSLLFTQNIDKVLHKVFKSVKNNISQVLPITRLLENH